jgi:hypothetical protein
LTGLVLCGTIFRVHPVLDRDVWYAPVREDGASRIGNRLKLNEFAWHKKKMKKLLDRKLEL